MSKNKQSITLSSSSSSSPASGRPGAHQVITASSEGSQNKVCFRSCGHRGARSRSHPSMAPAAPQHSSSPSLQP